MNGHEAIIRMRQNGKKPSFVFINDFPCSTDWEQHGDHATVCIDGDDIDLLDLRFLIGLKVSCMSKSERRAKAIFEACKAFGATSVGCTSIDDKKRAWEQDGWSQIWHAEKTNG